MARDEGVRSLWRGSSLTEAILARRGSGADGLATHVAASFTAGIVVLYSKCGRLDIACKLFDAQAVG